MNKVKLKFKGVSEIVGTEAIGLLIMVDEEERRQLTIPCDKSMIYQFGMRIKHVPVVNKLLPEVLWQVISTQTDMHFEILINSLIDGQFRAMLSNTDTLEPVSMRASDAILLAYISKIPVYIESGLMEKQSVNYDKKLRSISLPVNTVSDQLLDKALEKAIKDENYELASSLRDEILKRKLNREGEK